MRQHILPTAFLTFVYLFAVAVASPPPSPSPFVSPPGPTQDMRPPAASPAPTDVEPTDEPVAVTFAIVATKDSVNPDGTISTVEQTADVVEVIPGELLTLTVRGDAVLPVDGGPVADISWAINRRTGNAKKYPADGHHVTFSAPATDAGVYLFTAAVNNPDALGAPFLAQRWVVVRGAQPPPDDVEPAPAPQPTKPPTPSTAPVDVPGFRALLLYEALEGMPDAFASYELAEYLTAHCVKGEDGTTPEWRRHDDDSSMVGDFDVWEKYRAAAPAQVGKKDYPYGFVVVGNGTAGYAGPCPKTAAELLELVRKYGG